MRPSIILIYIDTRASRPHGHVAAAIERVAAFATAHGARIIVCDAIATPRANDPRSGMHQRLIELRERHALDTLRNFAKPVSDQVEIEATVFKGNPLIGITQLVITRGIELVVCVPPTSATGGLDSTCQHLLRKCPTAVWVMREMPRQRIARIAIAVDRDIFPASDEPRAMASQLLDAAIALSGISQAELHLVHAWEVYGAELLADGSNGLKVDEIEQYREAQRYAHTVWLQDLHQELRRKIEAHGDASLHSEIHLVEGAVCEVLPRWLERLGVDLLVIGTLGSSTVPGLLIGTTAETIISNTSIPLMTLKPFGFRSPLAIPHSA